MNNMFKNALGFGMGYIAGFLSEKFIFSEKEHETEAKQTNCIKLKEVDAKYIPIELITKTKFDQYIRNGQMISSIMFDVDEKFFIWENTMLKVSPDAKYYIGTELHNELMNTADREDVEATYYIFNHDLSTAFMISRVRKDKAKKELVNEK